MKRIYALTALIAALLAAAPASATPATNGLLARYKSEGAKTFDAERGKKAWTRQVKTAEGDSISCTACHGDDLSKAGKHRKTGRRIEPMAPSVNAERFTDEKKIEKWFKRNCHDVWGRECTAQEKGDILTFLLGK